LRYFHHPFCGLYHPAQHWAEPAPLATLATSLTIEIVMGLFRLLLLIAIIFAAIWLWRRVTAPAQRPRKPQDSPQPMVRCAHCGVHIPQQHALSQEQNWYCSQAHLEQGPSTGER
jgi:uncharacterized protein